MTKNDKSINVKLPKSIFDIYKEIYELPEDTFNYKVILYAISSSLPEKGRYYFAEDYDLDKNTLDQIIEKRKMLAKDKSESQLNKLDQKIENIEDALNSNNQEELQSKLDILQTLIRLLLADNFTLGNDQESLKKYLNTEASKAILDFAKLNK